MKNINFNEFRKMGMTLTIGEKNILVQFIPYPVEKEIYTKMGMLQDLFSNVMSITDEQIDMMKNWIWQIISHKRNENDVTEEIFDEIGMTEMIAIMIALIQFITSRIIGMQGLFGDPDTTQKKTAEKSQTTST